MKSRLAIAAAAAVVCSTWVVTGAQAQVAASTITFSMVRSSAALAANCLANARATVRIVTGSQNETMTITASGLPPNTEFDLFITQLPNPPFGLSWYQSDLQSVGDGSASVTVIGRFNVETFAVAPGVGAAPVVHPGRDGIANPAFDPIHTFHVGFWFNAPADAVRAGCQGTVTPFNGDHTAGVQAMSTRNFGDQQGPLRQLSS